MFVKIDTKQRRKNRVRKKITVSADRLRLSVFKSNKYIYAQIINDTEHKTLVAANSMKAQGKTFAERAYNTGKDLAERAIKADIKKVVFDRGFNRYNSLRIKRLAEGAREGGLEF